MLDKEMKYLVEGMVINWLKGYFWQDSRLCFVWMLSWNWNVWLSKRTSQTWSYVEHVVYFFATWCQNALAYKHQQKQRKETSKRKPSLFQSFHPKGVCFAFRCRWPEQCWWWQAWTGSWTSEWKQRRIRRNLPGEDQVQARGWTHGQWEFQDPKMEVRKRTIFLAIFCGDIPLHSPEQ